jgi:adenylate cyclase
VAPEKSVPPRLSIVVLPFANIGGGAEQESFVDGVTESLTTDLSRIRSAVVIARNTAFTYKGKPFDAKAIGNDLGVRYVLEGSVQPSGPQMRVNAQLIDAESRAHLWAEQFDTKRIDLLQTQDEIAIHLSRALEVRLTEAEAARLKRTRVANPDAEDLAIQCLAAAQKAGFVGKEADVGYSLCERALRVDPNNVTALTLLGVKFHTPVNVGTSTDPKADITRADEFVSRALVLDPTSAGSHSVNGWILFDQGRFGEAIAEQERAIDLDPADVGAMQGLGWAYLFLGQFEQGRDTFSKAIQFSPRDPVLIFMYTGKSWAYFGLKQYDQAIDWARRAIAVYPNFQHPHGHLMAALALSGHETEAREALQSYLSLPSSEGLRAIAAWKQHYAQFSNSNTDPRALDAYDREYEGLRKAGVSEG